MVYHLVFGKTKHNDNLAQSWQEQGIIATWNINLACNMVLHHHSSPILSFPNLEEKAPSKACNNGRLEVKRWSLPWMPREIEGICYKKLKNSTSSGWGKGFVALGLERMKEKWQKSQH